VTGSYGLEWVVNGEIGVKLLGCFGDGKKAEEAFMSGKGKCRNSNQRIREIHILVN